MADRFNSGERDRGPDRRSVAATAHRPITDHAGNVHGEYGRVFTYADWLHSRLVHGTWKDTTRDR